MRRALELAQATSGLAAPNPQVGCVIVRDAVIVGEGAHLYDNFDHAEIVALLEAGPQAAAPPPTSPSSPAATMAAPALAPTPSSMPASTAS